MTIIGSATFARKIAVLVVGTPGCGAQAVAQTLALLGARPTDRPEVAAAQAAFLQTVGSGWDDPLPLPESALYGRPARAFHDAVTPLLQCDGADGQIFALADSRLCVMLPLWRRVLDDAGVLPVVGRHGKLIPCRHGELTPSLRG